MEASEAPEALCVQPNLHPLFFVVGPKMRRFPARVLALP